MRLQDKIYKIYCPSGKIQEKDILTVISNGEKTDVNISALILRPERDIDEIRGYSILQEFQVNPEGRLANHKYTVSLFSADYQAEVFFKSIRNPMIMWNDHVISAETKLQFLSQLESKQVLQSQSATVVTTGNHDAPIAESASFIQDQVRAQENGYSVLKNGNYRVFKPSKVEESYYLITLLPDKHTESEMIQLDSNVFVVRKNGELPMSKITLTSENEFEVKNLS